MADYSFYVGNYLGNSISETDFPRLARRAEEQIARYKRVYTVAAPESHSEDMAVCAIADALYYFETVTNETQSVSVGSVSSSFKTAVDISPKAQERELYRCACLYLEIYRGVS